MAAGTEENEPYLEAVRQLANRLLRIPSTTDMADYGPHSPSTYYKRIGRWPEVLAAAGFEETTPDHAIPTEALRAALRRLPARLERAPTASDVETHTPYTLALYRERFGSLEAAFETVGISTRNLGKTYTEAELLNTLVALRTTIEKPPAPREIDEYSDTSAKTYERRFGSVRFALQHAYIDQTGYEQLILDRELEAELEFLGEKLGHAPNKWDMEHYGQYSPAPYLEREDTWRAVLERYYY